MALWAMRNVFCERMLRVQLNVTDKNARRAHTVDAFKPALGWRVNYPFRSIFN
jgi:hypothetical protein